MAKPLNVGLIGYGFMGRAHSNAYAKVNHFFDLAYRPALKAVCARSAWYSARSAVASTCCRIHSVNDSRSRLIGSQRT